jgi:hypothetical protein
MAERDELEAARSALDELEAEHLRVAGLLADTVDELRGAGWCEEYGYGDPVGDVRRLQVRAIRAECVVVQLRHELRQLRYELEELRRT